MKSTSAKRKNNRPVWCEYFTKLQRAPRTKPFGVFDMETAGGTLLGPPAGIAFTSHIDYPNILRFSNERGMKHHGAGVMTAFLAHVLTKRYQGYVFYAHKGLSFDLAHLFGNTHVIRWLIRRRFVCHIDKSFIAIRKGHKVWMFADSLRLIPDKLENVLGTFVPEITKAPLPDSPFSWRNPAWRNRIENDTRGLYLALQRLETIMLEHFGVPLSLTMPATALRAARTMLPVDQIHRPSSKALDWIRAGAYGGGRIEIFYQGIYRGPISVLDINSAYAWAMKGDFPIGPGIYTKHEPSQHSALWIARCKVLVPNDAFIPPVLSRLYHHRFPIGDFQAIITNEEAELARKSGAQVHFIEGFYWKERLPVFRAFIEKCETLRRQDYKGPLGQSVKLAQNGLYGILGMNSFRKVYALSESELPLPWMHCFNSEKGQYVPNTYEAVLHRESPNHMAHWAAIITARVRVRLSSILLEAERNGLIPLYAHTDSIWFGLNGARNVRSLDHLISPAYGDLKNEGQGTRAVLVAPGEAAIYLTSNEWKVANKGWNVPGNANQTDKEKKDAIAKVFTENSGGKRITLRQTQMFRAGTALRRRAPGREITKHVRNYEAIRSRISPSHRPGFTMPRPAEALSYQYWHYRNWHVGKLLFSPPRILDARKSRILSPNRAGPKS